jgi:hypothetical protein
MMMKIDSDALNYAFVWMQANRLLELDSVGKQQASPLRVR